jgi:hypothetical protein
MDRAERLALEPSPNLRNNPLNPVPTPDVMRSIPRYLHFQRLRTTAIRHFPAGKKLSKESRWRLLLIGEYAKKRAARFPESGKARKEKEIESAFERVRIVTQGKAAIVEDLPIMIQAACQDFGSPFLYSNTLIATSIS